MGLLGALSQGLWVNHCGQARRRSLVIYKLLLSQNLTEGKTTLDLLPHAMPELLTLFLILHHFALILEVFGGFQWKISKPVQCLLLNQKYSSIPCL